MTVPLLHQQRASFDTRRGFTSALLRMRDVVDGIKSIASSERERSEQSPFETPPLGGGPSGDAWR
jgi:hypothetical protein